MSDEQNLGHDAAISAAADRIAAKLNIEATGGQVEQETPVQLLARVGFEASQRWREAERLVVLNRVAILAEAFAAIDREHSALLKARDELAEWVRKCEATMFRVPTFFDNDCGTEYRAIQKYIRGVTQVLEMVGEQLRTAE